VCHLGGVGRVPREGLEARLEEFFFAKFKGRVAAAFK